MLSNLKAVFKTFGCLKTGWLHDNSNFHNSNSYEIFQGAKSQNII